MMYLFTSGRKLFVLAALLGWSAIMLYWLWQPERQTAKHHDHLLAALEKRDWNKVASFIDPAYADRWNHDKSFVLGATREVFRQFFGLTIHGDALSCRQNGDTVTLSARITIEGTGTALAQMAMQRVNTLEEPFTFEWKHRSWKPWDWTLVRVDQPQLQLEEMSGFEQAW
jgi:hypothetical protein